MLDRVRAAPKASRHVPPAAGFVAPNGPLAAVLAGRRPDSVDLLTAGDVLALQRHAGNAAVGALLGTGRSGARTRPGPVQRLGLSDVTGAANAVLPTAVLSALGAARRMVDGKEGEARAAVEAGAGGAVNQISAAQLALDGEMGSLAWVGGQQAASAEARAGATGAALRQQANALSRQGTAAAAILRGLASPAATLVSPASAILRPAETASAADTLAAQGAAAGGAKSAGGLAVSPTTVIGPTAAPQWNCDLTSAVSLAAGVEQAVVNGAVSLGERAVGAERMAQIRRFGTAMRDGVGRVAASVRGTLSSFATSGRQKLGQAARAITEPAGKALDAAQKAFTGLRTRAASAWADAKTRFAKRWTSIKETGRRAIEAVGSTARGAMQGAASAVRGAIGGVGAALRPLLPGWATSLIDGIPAKVAAVEGHVREAGRRVANAAADARKAAFAAVKAVTDRVLQGFARQKQLTEDLLRRAGDLARRAGRAAVDAIPESIKKPIGAAIASARQHAARFMSAADRVGARIRNGACVVLGATAGPCVTQHLPDLGGGLRNTVKVTSRGDVTVPLAEIGVPANLKIGAGAAVAITAHDGTYTVQVTGDAAIFLNETVANEAHAEAGGTGGAAPQLPAGPMAAAWQALNGRPAPVAPGGGGSATPASPAGSATPVPAVPSGPTPAVDPGGAAVGGGPDVELNAGIRGSTDTEWRFNAAAAPTSCEGVGGLVTLLSGLGVAGALPAPFNQVGTAAVYRGFTKEMTSSTFSAGLAGEVKVDLRTEGIGRLRGRLGGDISENIETVRDPATGELVTRRTRTITGELDATALGPFTARGFERFRIYAEAGGILRLTLAYEGDDIVPSTLGAAIKLTIGARNFEEKLLAGLFPEEVREHVHRLVGAALPGMEGPRELALSLTIGRIYTGLEPLGRELNAYFRGPVDRVNVEGVIAIARRNLAEVTPLDYGKLELSQTQRRTLAAGGTKGEGPAEGADAKVEGEHTISLVWVGITGDDELLTLAARRGRQARPEALEPKKPDPDQDKDQPCHEKLPIRWPGGLPRPHNTDDLVRHVSGVPQDYEKDSEEECQRDLAKRINQAEEEWLEWERRGRLGEAPMPPDPCFPDEVTEDWYREGKLHAHHILPRFIGGRDHPGNLCSLDSRTHLGGHRRLDDQSAMLDRSEWINCRVTKGQLRRHPEGQGYDVE